MQKCVECWIVSLELPTGKGIKFIAMRKIWRRWLWLRIGEWSREHGGVWSNSGSSWQHSMDSCCHVRFQQGRTTGYDWIPWFPHFVLNQMNQFVQNQSTSIPMPSHTTVMDRIVNFNAVCFFGYIMRTDDQPLRVMMGRGMIEDDRSTFGTMGVRRIDPNQSSFDQRVHGSR